MAELHPFDESGVVRDAAGAKRYTAIPGSVVELLHATVEAFPDQEAIVELDGARLSYRELWDRSSRVAGGLRSAGVRRGDRVGIRHGNGIDWVLAFFGAQLAGAVAVPINTRFAEPEVNYVVSDCAPRVVLGPGSALPDATPYADEHLAPTDLAAIFYTSGTTGFPKGAMTTHLNFCTNAENALRVSNIPRDDKSLRNLMCVPLFHVTACNSQLLPTMYAGGSQVIMPTFDVERFLRATVQERIGVLTAVPAIYWYALSRPDFATYDTSGVRWVSYGGAPIAPSLVRDIQKSFPNARVGNGFGLTETSSVSTFLPHEYADTHADSVGFPAPTVDLRIASPSPETGVGELLIRGTNVVAGYWNKPEATAQTFVDGWLHTGDLARIDAQGFTYIVDRIKDMINRGGENVYCVEVENVLAAAPGVFEVAVVGVPDPMMGEKVGAVLVPAPGATVDRQRVLGYAREQLADFKVPQYLAVSQEPLPRNASGKVLKDVLRKTTTWST
jgi:long-chain acyl-CoA synthetase